MIPSTPDRTWLFLGASLLLYFAPDLLAPRAWNHHSHFQMLTSCYQGVLVLLGFGYGPAICRALVVREIGGGPLRTAVDQALAMLPGSQRLPPIILAAHTTPFSLTAGLLPKRCRIFVSSALVGRLSAIGLRFLIARATEHASPRQRLAAILPVLAFTVALPDPKGLEDWLVVCAFLAFWLLLHWVFELDADRRAARMMGAGASDGLREVHAISASPVRWLTPSPPLNWRLRAVARQTSSPPG